MQNGTSGRPTLGGPAAAGPGPNRVPKPTAPPPADPPAHFGGDGEPERFVPRLEMAQIEVVALPPIPGSSQTHQMYGRSTTGAVFQYGFVDRPAGEGQPPTRVFGWFPISMLDLSKLPPEGSRS